MADDRQRVPLDDAELSALVDVCSTRVVAIHQTLRGTGLTTAHRQHLTERAELYRALATRLYAYLVDTVPEDEPCPR